jgi:hypothetical protein
VNRAAKRRANRALAANLAKLQTPVVQRQLVACVHARSIRLPFGWRLVK